MLSKNTTTQELIAVCKKNGVRFPARQINHIVTQSVAAEANQKCLELGIPRPNELKKELNHKINFTIDKLDPTDLDTTTLTEVLQKALRDTIKPY